MESVVPWREKAAEFFPELASVVREAADPYGLWTELWMKFEDAYGAPRNESLIKRIYMYANWCVAQPRGKTAKDDLATCVTVCFHEHIPGHPEARKDMPRWFSLEDLQRMKETFCYHLSEVEFADLLQYFKENRETHADRFAIDRKQKAMKKRSH
jgi:hypothetical protein